MDLAAKRQIHANEMTRRLLRVDPRILEREASQVINTYNRKLIFSGYPHEERIRIIEGGLSAYFTKAEAPGPLYKKASLTQEKRNLQKLTGKTS